MEPRILNGAYEPFEGAAEAFFKTHITFSIEKQTFNLKII